MTEPSIAVVVFGKNNEDIIGKTLTNVKPFADEILYMDTGSTDKTVEIVRQFTDRIYIVQNMVVRNNANYRNFLNSEASCKWTFFLDTDEVVTHQFANEIKGYLSQLENMPNVHHIYFKVLELIYDEKHTLTTPNFHPFLYHPRLALKKFAKWDGARHETYIGEGDGIFWPIFAYAHHNLLNMPRLREKYYNNVGDYGEYNREANPAPDYEIMKTFIGQAVIGEVPTGVTW